MNIVDNDFIEYLNSMNNANSSNKNALAESQVLSKYYDKIKIDRKLGEVLYEKLFGKNSIAVILTGHAGDGKTSILIQILNELGYFKNGKTPLSESELYNDELFYVKDMSELNEEKQKQMLKDFLKYPNRGISSLLISNTGPLLNTFDNILDKANAEILEIDLLNELDNNSLHPITVNIDGEDCNFIAVNMANIDNTYLVKQILSNLLQDELWDRCKNCEIKDKCPIAFNYFTCSKNLDRVSTILEQIYVWFKENESRLTIRQMLSHLSFALTGNLSCKKINKSTKYENDALFNYSFANLLFGYKGIEVINESLNIKAIKEIDKVSMDENALFADYKLFIREDFEMFDENIKFILEEQLNLHQLDLGIDSENATKLRRSLRRFYILFSKLDESEFEKLKKDVFSEAFNTYYKLTKESKISNKEKTRLKDVVFEGLYKTFVGVYSKDEDNLYLTVKKELDDIQNVQLILGDVPKDDIYIRNELKQSPLKENPERYELKIKFRMCKDLITLTYQMYQYFMRISEGEVFTSLNPSFTFGLNNLKADLLKNYRYYKEDEFEDDPKIKLLVIKKDGVDKINFIVEDGEMQIL